MLFATEIEISFLATLLDTLCALISLYPALTYSSRVYKRFKTSLLSIIFLKENKC